ncbi:MFS transporter [Heyndrickxia coagulans]|uniref:MFS transporter n=1 Tax=Heyndrickxia coagulans TaxID=1398 RepID=UPI0004230724|nr:MFS transporter [Heyndrickxia coagulans]
MRNQSIFNTLSLSEKFKWFFLGQTVSLFGSAMTPVSLAFAILQVKQGQHLLGYILAAAVLPNILMLVIGGSIADRYRRDKLIRLSNLGSGCSQMGIAIIVLAGGNPYTIFPLAIINGILGAFTSPAMRGIIPELVERKHIKQANSLLNLSRSASKIVGPALAGTLVAIFGGGWGIAIDAVSFFIASIFMSRVHIPSHPVVSKTSFMHEIREGWSYFRKRRWIWLITGAFALINAVQMGVWQVLGPIIAKNTIGSTGWGLTLSIKAVGLLIASLVMLKLQLRYPLRDSLIAVAFGGIPLIVLGQGFALPYLLIVTAIAGVGQTISGIGWDTTLQQAIPRNKLSRVLAFDDLGAFITIPIGQVMAVPLAEIFGYKMVATVGGIVFILVALIPLLDRSIRKMNPEKERFSS